MPETPPGSAEDTWFDSGGFTPDDDDLGDLLDPHDGLQESDADAARRETVFGLVLGAAFLALIAVVVVLDVTTGATRPMPARPATGGSAPTEVATIDSLLDDQLRETADLLLDEALAATEEAAAAAPTDPEGASGDASASPSETLAGGATDEEVVLFSDDDLQVRPVGTEDTAEAAPRPDGALTAEAVAEPAPVPTTARTRAPRTPPRSRTPPREHVAPAPARPPRAERPPVPRPTPEPEPEPSPVEPPPATSEPSGGESATTLVSRAEQRLRAGDPKRAAEDFKKALTASPGHTHARRGLAEAYYDMNQSAAAEKQLKVVLRQSPGHGRARLLMASVAQEKGRRGEARQHYERYLKSHPSGPKADEVRRILSRL